jgi:hypothetical protein
MWSKGHGSAIGVSYHFTRGLWGDWIIGDRLGPLVGCSPLSNYWTYRSHAGYMDPVSLVICCRQKLDLRLLLHWLRVGEKLDGDLQIGQPTGWGCSLKFFFLRSSEIHPNLSITHERLLCVDRVRYIWSGIIRGLSVGCTLLVGRVCTAGCTSIRIAATLGYE